MKKWISLLVALFSLPALAQDDQGMVELIGIPVMEGLSEVADARLVFDKPEGRIIHIELSGDRERDQALAFYKETLFQLGWVLEGERWDKGKAILIFVREGEQLSMTLGQGSPLDLVFELGPPADETP